MAAKIERMQSTDEKQASRKCGDVHNVERENEVNAVARAHVA
jgi:hypothetical protein